MPREAIRQLENDVERVLEAGAHLARGDAGLERGQQALEKLVQRLGAKAPPVLGRLADQTGKVLGAKPKDEASELLTLAMMVSQVRAAQADLAPAEGGEPLPPVAAVSTPCNAKDLYDLHDALVTTGPGRLEKIQEAIQRNDVADLRLVHAVIQAMGDPYGDLAERVSNDVVPAFGRAIVDPVLSKLKFPGRVVDGRRLKALVAVEKAAARPLLERALGEGSAEMREAALDAIASHAPGVAELEPLVLELLEKERAGGVRRAAVRALKGFGSDASLDALLEAMDDDRTVEEAAEALGESKHPEVVDRLIERLGSSVQGAKTKVKKTDEAGEKKRAAHETRVRCILGALAALADPKAVPVAKELIADFGADAARAVLGGGSEDDVRAIAASIEGDDAGLFEVAVSAAVQLGPDEAFDRLSPVVTAKDRGSKLGKARLEALADRWRSSSPLVPSGERWLKVLLGALKSKPRPDHVITLLGMSREPRAVKPLLEVLSAEKKNATTIDEVVTALSRIGDASAVDGLLTLVDDKTIYRRYWHVHWVVEQLATPATVDQVRTLYAKQKNPDTSPLRWLLARLERKFPGA